MTQELLQTTINMYISLNIM